MATTTLSSNYSSGVSRYSQAFEFGNDSQGRNLSFSSYLNKSEESYVRNLAAESNKGSFAARICGAPDDNRAQLGNKKNTEDGEIGVFGAEKYFNGIMDDEDTSPRMLPDTVVAKLHQLKKDDDQLRSVETIKCRVQPGTPNSVRSGSSWNSQSALLQSALRNSSWKKSKVQGKRVLAGLRCKCYCSGKNAVDISDHQIGEISLRRPHSMSPSHAIIQDKAVSKKLLATGIEPKNFAGEAQTKSTVRKDVNFHKAENLDDLGFNKVNGIEFPYVSSDVKVKLQQAPKKEEIPRKSREVFGSPVEKRNRSFSFDKRTVVQMLPWDASPRLEEIELCVNSGGTGNGIFNDAASDASSDLFEIESLNSSANPFLSRQGSGATSGCTYYAPSDASVEWSVVTASAAEFSVFSDSEDQRSPIASAPPRNIASTTSPHSKEMHRRRPGLILGCRSHKAVKVAGDACRANVKPNKSDPQSHLKTDPLPKM